MADGTVAGLVSSRELQEEARQMKGEAEKRRCVCGGAEVWMKGGAERRRGVCVGVLRCG